MSAPRNIHATAIVIGTRGFLFTGPSGSGKSALALTCLAQAEARGIYCAFVGDDQVLLSEHNGRIVAESIASIAGLAEARGCEILNVPQIAAAVIDFVFMPVSPPLNERLPTEHETYTIDGLGDLPLLRLRTDMPEALDLLLRLSEKRLSSGYTLKYNP